MRDGEIKRKKLKMVPSDVSGPCINSYQLFRFAEKEIRQVLRTCFEVMVQKKGHTATRSLKLPVEIDDTTTKALSDVF